MAPVGVDLLVSSYLFGSFAGLTLSYSGDRVTVNQLPARTQKNTTCRYVCGTAAINSNGPRYSVMPGSKDCLLRVVLCYQARFVPSTLYIYIYIFIENRLAGIETSYEYLSPTRWMVDAPRAVETPSCVSVSTLFFSGCSTPTAAVGLRSYLLS